LSFVALGLAFAVTGAPTAAQGAQALRIERDGRSVDEALFLWGWGRWPDRDNPPMRAPIPKVDPSKWFGPGSAIAKAHAEDPRSWKYLVFTLEVSAQGKVIGCTPHDERQHTGRSPSL
jgi:hypothetical protein